MKTALIDIDGVLVNSTKRFEAATHDGKIDWEKALNSNALHLDTLIPHATEHLATILQQGYQIVLLTSRYDHMRDATLAWLKEHGVVGFERAIFKPWETERHTKTKKWKAEQVVKLLQESSQANLWSTPQEAVTGLLIVDDEQTNRDEMNNRLNDSMQNFEYAIFRSSLQEAAERLTKGITL